MVTKNQNTSSLKKCEDYLTNHITPEAVSLSIKSANAEIGVEVTSRPQGTRPIEF